MSSRNYDILVLEDDPDWIDKLRAYLHGYRVSAARTLGEAYDLLQKQGFDLAIVDISLVPNLATDEKGLRFVEGLRQIEFLRDLKIIIVTAYRTTDRIRQAFREYDVYDFLDKGSLTSQEFRKIVAQALGEEAAT
jgi:CheY-like chemotaxis protein